MKSMAAYGSWASALVSFIMVGGRAEAQGFGRVGLWSHLRASGQAVVRTGDFNGDGIGDVVCFTRDTDGDDRRGDVWVSLGTRDLVGRPFEKWHDFLCVGQEVPLTGDFNGDGKDDVVVFIRSTKLDAGIGDVGVALSQGTGFGPLNKWHEDFCRGALVPAVGDVNGDGKDDLVAFVKSTPHEGVAEGQVYVALSRGELFDAASVWHDWFGIGSEVPFVADFDGDGRADLATWIAPGSGSPNGGTVYVSKALPAGRFGGSTVWTDGLGRGLGDSVADAGDVDGDGKSDLVVFERGNAGRVTASLSDGNRLLDARPVAAGFCAVQEWPLLADLNGDRRAELVKRSGGQSGDIFVAVNQGAGAAPVAVAQAVPAVVLQPLPTVAVMTGGFWTFRMTELLIERGEEDASEPYFITLWFKGQLGVPGSTLVSLVPVGDPDWAQNMPARVSRSIPRNIGEIHLGQADPLTRQQIEAGSAPVVTGVIVAAYEHDETSDANIRSIAEAWRASAQQKLSMTLDRHTAANISEAVRELSAVFGALFAEASTRFRAVASALNDNDEYLSTCGRFWYAVDPAWLQEKVPGLRLEGSLHHGPLLPTQAQTLPDDPNHLFFSGGAGRHHVGWTLSEMR